MGKVIREEVKLNSCIHLGQMVNQGIWWCNKQFDEPTEIHTTCNCKACPDFEAYTYTVETTVSEPFSLIPEDTVWKPEKRMKCSICQKYLEKTDKIILWGTQYICKDCLAKQGKLEVDSSRIN